MQMEAFCNSCDLPVSTTTCDVLCRVVILSSLLYKSHESFLTLLHPRLSSRGDKVVVLNGVGVVS